MAFSHFKRLRGQHTKSPVSYGCSGHFPHWENSHIRWHGKNAIPCARSLHTPGI